MPRNQIAHLLTLVLTVAACEDTPLWQLPSDEQAPPSERPPTEGSQCSDTVQAISLRPTPTSIDFMFFLDRSGSMDEPIVENGGDEIPTRYEKAIEILRDLLPELGASNQVAVQTFPFSAIDPSEGVEPQIPSNVLGICATCSDAASCQPKSCGADGDCRSGLCRGGTCLCESQRICDDGFTCAERFCGDPGSAPISDPAPICNDMNDCNPSGGQVQCRSFNEIYVTRGEPSQEEKCELERYVDPVLGFSSDDAAILETIDRLASQGLTDSTPMGTALTGTRPYVEAWQHDHPERRVIQVIMSDGKAEGCDVEEPEYIRDLLGELYNGPLKVPTFLFGFFEEGADELETMDSYAESGGTDEAVVVELGIDFGQNFADALRAVSGGVVSCAVAFPELSPPADPDRIDLDITIGAGGAERLVAAYDESACEANPRGWYFEPSPSSGALPTALRVCPRVCDDLRAAPSADVQLSLGCEAPVRNFYP